MPMMNGNVANGQAMQKEYGSHKDGAAGESSVGCVSYAKNLLLFTYALFTYLCLTVTVTWKMFTVLTVERHPIQSFNPSS